jgi:hypothetical protein
MRELSIELFLEAIATISISPDRAISISERNNAMEQALETYASLWSSGRRVVVHHAKNSRTRCDAL